MMAMKIISKKETQLAIIFLVILSILPYLVSDALVYILGLTFIFVIFAVSWDLMVGYTGQVNLGHTIFIGIGGYITALIHVPSRLEGTALGFLTWISSIPLYLSIILGGIGAAIIGLAIGVITLRLKGWYFALVTAVLPFVFIEATIVFRDIFGGEEGFSVGLGNALASSTIGKYYTSLLIMSLSVAGMYLIANSRLGIRFKVIREDPELAESIGIDTFKYKLYAFIISSFFAGIGGATLVHYRVTLSPDLFDIPLMLLIILAAVIGGLGTLVGPLMGGFIIYLLKYWWLKQYMNIYSTLAFPINDDIILYTVLILIAIMAPEGLWMKIKKLTILMRRYLYI